LDFGLPSIIAAVPHLLFIVICVVWGGSFMLMKQALHVVGPIGVGGWRVLLGAVALGAVWQLRRQPWPITRGDVAPLVGIGLVGYALPFVLQPIVIAHVDRSSGHGSAFAGMMVAFVPLLTILVSIPMLGVRPTRRQLIGVIAGLIALVLLMSEELRQAVSRLDLALGVVTPICYAIANTYVKRRFSQRPALLVAALTMATAAVVLLPLSLALEPMRHAGERALVGWLSLAALGVVCTGLGYCWFYVIIRLRGPLFAGMVAYIIPCVAMLIGFAFGERIGLRQALCLAAALSATAFVQTARPVAPAPASR
jgi:drug/metabolite transporter (DMT)-like permease